MYNSETAFQFEKLLVDYSTEPPPFIPTPDETRTPVEIEDFLEKHTHITLLGAPGSGKSTTLRNLFRTLAQTEPSGVIPVYVELNQWHSLKMPLITFLQEQLTKRGANELAYNLPALLKEGRIILLLDALNEMPRLIRNNKTGVINDPRATSITVFAEDYPKVKCVLTCRLKDFAVGPNWRDLHLLDLTREQIEAFTAAYYDTDVGGAELTHNLIKGLYETSDENRLKLRSLVVQPFYLVRLLDYYQYYKLQGAPDSVALPANLAQLLKFSIDEAINRELEGGRLKKEEISDLKIKLANLAFNMTDAKQTGAVKKEIAAIWLSQKASRKQTRLTKASSSELTLAERIWQKAEGAGLITIAAGEVQFYHTLVQEYFCAYYLVTQPFTLKLFHRLTYDEFNEVWPIWGGLDGKLLEKLKSMSSNVKNTVRWQAVAALGKLGDRRAVDLLIASLKERDSEVRMFAAEALGRLGDKKALEALVTALKDIHWDVRAKAAEALGRLGDERAATPLVNALKDSNLYLQESASYALNNLDNQRAVDLIVNNFKGAGWQARFNIMRALGKLGAVAVPPLLKVLEEENNIFVQGSAAEALGQIGDRRAVTPLIKALAEKSSYVRGSAAEALGQIGDDRAIGVLIESAGTDINGYVRGSAIEALGRLGKTEALEIITRKLNDQDSYVRANAVLALAKVGDSFAVELLNRMLADKDSYVRGSAAFALARIGDQKSFQHLVIALADPDIYVRVNAARSLGELGNKKALPELNKFLRRNTHRWNTPDKEAVKVAIRQIKAQEGVATALQSFTQENKHTN